MSLVVIERSTGLEYRFVPEGPHIVETDWRAALHAIETKNMDDIVASGSVPRGRPTTSDVRLANIAAARNAKLVLDTSGEALKSVLAYGGVYLSSRVSAN